MENEQTDKTDTSGKKPDTPVEVPKETQTPLEKLKAYNVEFEAELVKGREFEAERQRLEANQMLGGTAGERVETEPVDEDQVMADKLLAESE